MSGELYNVPFWVVRKKDTTEFVRAFLATETTEESIKQFTENSELFTCSLEISHLPDKDGSILHLQLNTKNK